jgi:hypothetical protein
MEGAEAPLVPVLITPLIGVICYSPTLQKWAWRQETEALTVQPASLKWGYAFCRPPNTDCVPWRIGQSVSERQESAFAGCRRRT